MDRLGILIGITLAIIIMLIGYGIYSGIVSEADEWVSEGQEEPEEDIYGAVDEKPYFDCEEGCCPECGERARSAA